MGRMVAALTLQALSLIGAMDLHLRLLNLDYRVRIHTHTSALLTPHQYERNLLRFRSSPRQTKAC